MSLQFEHTCQSGDHGRGMDGVIEAITLQYFAARIYSVLANGRAVSLSTVRPNVEHYDKTIARPIIGGIRDSEMHVHDQIDDAE
jgi:hypothetical protein